MSMFRAKSKTWGSIVGFFVLVLGVLIAWRAPGIDFNFFKTQKTGVVGIEPFSNFTRNTSRIGAFSPGTYFEISKKISKKSEKADFSRAGLIWGSRNLEFLRHEASQSELTFFGFSAYSQEEGFGIQKILDRNNENRNFSMDFEIEFNEHSLVGGVENRSPSRDVLIWIYFEKNRKMEDLVEKVNFKSSGKQKILCTTSKEFNFFNLKKSLKNLQKNKKNEKVENNLCFFKFLVPKHSKGYFFADFQFFFETFNPEKNEKVFEENAEKIFKNREIIFSKNRENWEKSLKIPEKVVKSSELFTSAIANLLGSIGVFQGRLPVLQEGERGWGEKERTLISGVPSRSFFPRGFFWDEGFHLLGQIVALENVKSPPKGSKDEKVEVESADGSKFSGIVFEILSSWLDLEEEGWVPREVALGERAQRRVPRQFLFQDRNISNPPALLLPISLLFSLASPELKAVMRDQWGPLLRRVFNFLKSTFSGSAAVAPCFRWTDRSSAHCLSSGLDDFPRGLLVSEEECHLDLHVWLLFFERALKRIEGGGGGRGKGGDLEFFKTELDLNYFGTSVKKATSSKLVGFADFLGPQPLDRRGRVEVVPPWTDNGQCGAQNGKMCNPFSSSPCCSPSGWCGGSREYCECPGCVRAKPDDLQRTFKKIKKVHSPHIGYVNLFPFLLGIVDCKDAESLDSFSALTSHLLSPAGVRSLSPSDPLYRGGGGLLEGEGVGQHAGVAGGGSAGLRGELREGGPQRARGGGQSQLAGGGEEERRDSALLL